MRLAILLLASIAQAQVAVNLNGSTASAPMIARPATSIVSLTCKLADLEPDEATDCTLTLNQAARPGTLVVIIVPAWISAPKAVVVPTGQTTATFAVKRIGDPAPTAAVKPMTDLFATSVFVYPVDRWRCFHVGESSLSR